LEARGEIRGGRFVHGYVGEQFALPEAVDALRAVRRQPEDRRVTVGMNDPLYTAQGWITGPEIASLPAAATSS
jgi:ATP-dependent Lhr-like helicase